MPKVKTNSGSKKRFTFTGSGKIKRKHAYKSHISATSRRWQQPISTTCAHSSVVSKFAFFTFNYRDLIELLTG